MSRLSRPLVCPILVGRDQECADLADLLDGTASTPVILVSGEAGVGKSRLVRFLAAAAQQQGWLAIEGHCYEQAGRGPYAGIADLLRSIARAHSPAARAEGFASEADAVARSIPGAPNSEPSIGGDADADRARLFEGLRTLVEHIGSEAPLLVIVEDVHWADDLTLEALVFLARQARSLPLLLVMTFREEERPRALARAQAVLEREHLVAEMRLHPLEATGVARMIEAIVGRPVMRPDLVRSLHRRTGGVPFLVEEILRSALAEESDPTEALVHLDEARLPASIEEAVARRLDAISTRARELLDLAAVVGDDFDLPLLGAVSHADERELLGPLRELVAEQLLDEVRPTEFRFWHALTRDVIRNRLLATDRRALHTRVAAALLDRIEATGEDATDRLAFHLFGSEDWPSALRYGLRAGTRALQLHDAPTALEHLRRASTAAVRGGLRPPAELPLARARAFEATGNFEESARDFEQAVDLATAAGDALTLVDALLGLGLLWASRDYSQTHRYLDAAVGTARAAGDPLHLARALARAGNWYANTGQYEEARARLDEALVFAKESGDERSTAETLDLLGMTALLGGRPLTARQPLQSAAEAFQRLDDPRAASSPLSTLPVTAGTLQTSMLPAAMTLPAAIEFGEAGLAAARSANDPIAVAYAEWQLAFACATHGEHARATELAGNALQLARSAGHRQWALGAVCVLAAVGIDLLDPDDALTLLPDALSEANELGSDLWVHQIRSLLGDAHLLRGDVGGAAEQLASMGEPGALSMSLGWRHALEVELLLAEGRAGRALDLIAEAPLGEAGLRIRRARGRALLDLGRPEEASVEIEAALHQAHSEENAGLEWRLMVDLAHTRTALGVRELARAAEMAAAERVDAVADRLEQDRAERFRLAALALLPHPSAPPAVGATGPLTRRELEVARLVAQGMTNRAIADALVVSTRTVESHVASAMSRLDLHSRAALAAWVVQHHPA